MLTGLCCHLLYLYTKNTSLCGLSLVYTDYTTNTNLSPLSRLNKRHVLYILV